MKKLIGILILAWACTNEEDAARALRVQGYTDVNLTGYSWLGCSESDNTCTGFEAKGPTGERVTGAVGCSLTGCGKGCTVRIR